MYSKNQGFWALLFIAVAGIAVTARFVVAQPAALETSFDQTVKPFLNQNCVRCHNGDKMTSGVRVDQLDAKLDDRHLVLWETIREKIRDEEMPPADQPQPTAAERERMVKWITDALVIAKTRQPEKNGLIRRLTVAQYRNTLRELLLLDDNLTDGLPPDAVSKDGFLNNKETLQLSPLLTEAYFEIAEEALRRSIVDPKVKPTIQNFRLDFGTSINPKPIAEKLVLGAGSTLLPPEDFTVKELTPIKPFPFTPFFMQTKYRFIEGYQGNDTVRGWRDFDSIYHAVFADFRGSNGYPKGKAYGTVPQGLLLRPAIPNDETFSDDGTYGPKANFKIALRELPDDGRFRVTVTAAKYNDGLLLDSGTKEQTETPGSVTIRDRYTPVTIKTAGIYQVHVYAPPAGVTATPDTLRLNDGLAASGPLNGRVESPFGKAVSLADDADSATIPHNHSMNVGAGDFTVAAWIQPSALRKAEIAGLGGWKLGTSDNRGTLQFETSSGSISSQPGAIRTGAWQHVAAVVRRGKNETRLYVNGFIVARGSTGPANLDSPKGDLRIGSLFRGELVDVRLYRRTISEAEIQGLILPGKQFATPPAERRGPPQGGRPQGPRLPDVTLDLGDRQFTGSLQQSAFLAVRLEAGPLQVGAMLDGLKDAERIVLTPLAVTHEVSKRFLAFEKRSPRVGVHLGLRRDCGSSLVPVGPPQTVAGGLLTRYVFEGALRNFPNPEVEKDNVNYLAGVREIGVRSEYTDGRDIPRLLIRTVEFEGPFYDTWPPPSHKKIFVDSDARTIIRQFATRAYRRPVTAAEEAVLVGVYSKATASGRSFQEGIKDALQVVLTSPQFLFLVENSRTPAPEPLDNYELASKLSYFLWNGPPDRQTLLLAANGTLRKQLDLETARMIGDSRFSQFLNDFASQWLSLDKFQVLEPERRRYPKLTRETRTQLKQEPVEFLRYLVRNNLPVKNLIQSDFIVANEVIANYYDLGDKTEKGFQFVAIPHGRPELGGVLTQAAVMAGLSDGRESNPVKRGAWLARKIIAEPPADPPPNVPALKEEAQNLTLRQRLEQHRNVPACLQCHQKIDPWGVAFEEFDAGGRLKTQPTDARSTLPDKTEVAGANDLKRYLADDRIDQVAFSFLKHLTIYATGRSLTYNELNYLKKDGLKLKAGGYRMKDMIRYVVNSEMFLEK
jgi:mono/diheme cytochrome c family protein